MTLDSARESFREWFVDVLRVKFCKNYRHGLLHQVAFSVPTEGDVNKCHGGLRDSGEAISITKEGNFWVNPVKFSERVLEIIQGDFFSFLGEHSPHHPLPKVGPIGTVELGTASPEMWKEEAFKSPEGNG